jgi:hypothetical protein
MTTEHRRSSAALSGTTLLPEMVAAHPNARYVGETVVRVHTTGVPWSPPSELGID